MIYCQRNYIYSNVTTSDAVETTCDSDREKRSYVSISLYCWQIKKEII